MTHDDHCSCAIDTGAHVLKALAAEEDRAFLAHLGSCDHCRLEVRDLRLVVDTLPLAAPQTTPPAALKGRIMAVVEREAALLHAAGPEADRPASARPSRRSRLAGLLGTPMRPALAGALACGLLALGVAGGVAVEGSGSPETQSLRAWAKGPAEARLVQTGDRASLELVDMPSLQEGEVYQVWFDRGDDQLRPTHTVFNVRSDGRAKVAIDEPVGGVERILVSVEPSGDSLAPSSAPVITASPA